MKLGVETQYMLEELMNKQGRQIFNDAADFGIPYNEMTTKSIRQALEFVKGLEDGKPISDKRLGVIKQQTYWCPIEVDDGMVYGICIEVSLMRIEKRYTDNVLHSSVYTQPAFYTFNIHHEHREERPRKRK